MSNITQIDLTNGVPTGPTGSATVSTIDNLIGAAGSPSANVLSVQGVGGGTALPVAGTVTSNDGGAAGTGISQPSGGSGVSGWLSGIYNKLSSALSVAQSGTWTMQPGNTANTTPWLATVSQGGNAATVTSANNLRVDGSTVTQPVQDVGTGNFATSQVSVGSSATSIVSARTGAIGTGRKSVTITNLGTTAVWIGGSGVTTSTGTLLPGVAGAALTIETQAAVYGVVASGSQTVSELETY